jgi:Bax protein
LSKQHLIGFKTVQIIILVSLIVSCNGTDTNNKEVKATNIEKIITSQIELESVNDIVDLTDTLIAPNLYGGIKGLDSLPVKLKKEKFIAALLPSILVIKHKLANQLDQVQKLIDNPDWSSSDSTFYLKLAKTYKINNIKRLEMGLTTHPNSIILAQAVVESGWGNSRIFANANNLFGIWSYNKNEPRIASSVKRGDKTIYLRKYADISESIENYFVTIARTGAYRQFREARMNTDDPFELTQFLDHYSERRQAYVDQLNELIRYNDLTQYDNYQIDPAYISH